MDDKNIRKQDFSTPLNERVTENTRLVLCCEKKSPELSLTLSRRKRNVTEVEIKKVRLPETFVQLVLLLKIEKLVWILIAWFSFVSQNFSLLPVVVVHYPDSSSFVFCRRHFHSPSIKFDVERLEENWKLEAWEGNGKTENAIQVFFIESSLFFSFAFLACHSRLFYTRKSRWLHFFH